MSFLNYPSILFMVWTSAESRNLTKTSLARRSVQDELRIGLVLN